MTEKLPPPIVRFTLSRGVFDRWCEEMLQDPYNHRVLAVDKERSWPRYMEQVVHALQRRLVGINWELVESDDYDTGQGDPHTVAQFLAVVRQIRHEWPTWRVAPLTDAASSHISDAPRHEHTPHEPFP